MTKDLRWRIITLQVVMIAVFGLGAVTALYAANFTQGQIRSQLEPQQIMMPKGAQLETAITEINEKYADLKPYIADLRKYEGQQVLTGDQAHVFAEGYLGMHVRDIDNGKPYSVLSGEARAEKDPVLKAKKDAMVQTAFRGETLKSMLNQAWGFGTMGTIAMYAGLGLAIAALFVTAALLFELLVAPRRAEQPARATLVATSSAS